MCFVHVQGKPTEASVEARIHEYGELDAKDYIPGAEVLEVEDEKEKGGTQEEGWLFFFKNSGLGITVAKILCGCETWCLCISFPAVLCLGLHVSILEWVQFVSGVWYCVAFYDTH